MRNSTILFFCLALAMVLAGCTAAHYRKSADKEVYRIIREKQKSALGRTNAFSIDTRYSHRRPAEIKPEEIIADRMGETNRTLTLPEALRLALENNQEFQLRKETVFLSALSLAGERFAYVPQFFAQSTASGERTAAGKETAGATTPTTTGLPSTVSPQPPSKAADEDVKAGVATKAGVGMLFKTGGRVSLNLANDLLRFYTGGRRDSAVSTIGLALSQPLLRGAGARIVAENLTQAERNVIYEIRAFSYFQDTFAYDIVNTYFRLVQQQDTVKNQYNNFKSRVGLRERSEALAFDRLAPFQADLAKQEELSARNSYILAVERYRTSLDQFKITLGLPVGYEFRLDENALTELEGIGLLPVPIGDDRAFRLALDRRPDLLNEIDAFEDSKRKIVVSADALKPGLLVSGGAELKSSGATDYARFDLNDYKLNGGIELDLPVNRKAQRNDYRRSIITFERQLRSLALFLDELKSDLRGDLRTLDQSRQSYEIQVSAKALADRRVESSELSLQAGRIQVREVVDAQTSRVQAYNAATAALVDYHLTRLRLLLDLGLLKTEREKFWLVPGEFPKSDEAGPRRATGQNDALITPEELFRNDKQP